MLWPTLYTWTVLCNSTSTQRFHFQKFKRNIIPFKHEQNRKDFLCLWISALVSGALIITQWQRILSVLQLLTPWSRIVLEKLIGFQLDKKFPEFYGIRRFFTAFTSARHLSLSWASSIQAIPPSWRSILPNLMSLLLCLGHTKVSIQVRGNSLWYTKKPVFKVRIFQHLVQSRSWRTTPCRLSFTAYLIYSQLPSISEAVPPSATWGRAMPWWQGPTYHGLFIR